MYLQWFPNSKYLVAIWENIKLSEGVGCTLSSDKNGYSLQRLQRLVAKVEYVVAIGY